MVSIEVLTIETALSVQAAFNNSVVPLASQQMAADVLNLLLSGRAPKAVATLLGMKVSGVETLRVLATGLCDDLWSLVNRGLLAQKSAVAFASLRRDLQVAAYLDATGQTELPTGDTAIGVSSEAAKAAVKEARDASGEEATSGGSSRRGTGTRITIGQVRRAFGALAPLIKKGVPQEQRKTIMDELKIRQHTTEVGRGIAFALGVVAGEFQPKTVGLAGLFPQPKKRVKKAAAPAVTEAATETAPAEATDAPAEG